MSSITVIEPRWVIPVEPAAAALEAHAVVIEDEHIAALLPVADATARFPDAPRVLLPEHALIPGLINLHTHAAMTLMRGMADDLALMDWLHNHIWPAEGRVVSDEFVYDGSMLACAEMLRGGITCFNDMYFFPEATARAALHAGMRAALGIIAIEFRSAYANDARDYLSKGMALRDTMRDEPLLSFCLAPHAPFSVSDDTLAQIAIYAGELDIPVHMHLHEATQEISDGLKAHGSRPIARLQKLGLLGPGLIAVHSVHLTPEEIALFARHGCSVAHCPSSNLKLASGIAPVADLLQAGVNIGIGTDGAASNNRLDMFEEMRLAALLAKGASGDPTAMPAHRALECATLGGARALGLQERLGSIVPGKLADLTAVALSATALTPCYDPVSHLVYAAGREQVTDVWVGGVRRLADRALVTIDETAIKARARQWVKRIRPS
ncbi:MAG: TRZ/ATZ family hydrolase [Betaproteobacteria bacterium]|jgi:5-methylthioadenosine/S-adenosylhomocysteine deaminase|nr:TRZ/ATZ family hydrolase [Betaproteobacteria bacterium]MDH4292864.1 TRZ/ATZ family hydrolase [Betaproteobacteria bacterium]